MPCKHILAYGPRSGQECSRYSIKGHDYCKSHYKSMPQELYHDGTCSVCSQTCLVVPILDNSYCRLCFLLPDTFKNIPLENRHSDSVKCQRILTKGPNKGTLCGRMTGHESSICYNCRLVNSKTNNPLMECSRLLTKGKRKGEVCGTVTRDSSGICCKCRKIKNNSDTNNNTAKCSRVIVRGKRKGDQCGISTKHSSGICSRCREVQSRSNYSGRSICSNVFSSGPRKDLRCTSATSHPSGICSKCRPPSDTDSKSSKPHKTTSNKSNKGDVIYPRFEAVGHNGDLVVIEGSKALDILAMHPIDILDRHPELSNLISKI